jgi:hypothetical protein
MMKLTQDNEEWGNWKKDYKTIDASDLIEPPDPRKWVEELCVSDEFRDFDLYTGDFEVLRLRCDSVEIVNSLIFDIPIPNTKQKLKTLLEILLP